jgi:hypothetical protein
MTTRIIVFIIFCIAEVIGLIAEGYLILDDNRYETPVSTIIKKMTDRAIFSCIVYLLFM